jgi:hypothetical protein
MRVLLVAAWSLLVCLPTPSQAVSILGDGSRGDFTGSLSYSYTNAASATLTVTLTNTSPAANSGYLTAFVLNNPANLITGISLAASDPDFILLGGPSFKNGVSASPYGKFDFGASTGGGFLGSGSPSKGLGVGTAGAFTFTLTGSGLNTLSESSFVSALSHSPGGGGAQFFLARYRGFADGGSDKTPGTLWPSSSAVPEPSTLFLFGAGLAGYLLYRRAGRAGTR